MEELEGMIKLNTSFEKVKHWLISSDLLVSDIKDKNCGGVHSFYDEKTREYSFLYPEITGYFISTLRFLNSQDPNKKFSQLAEYSSDWLIDIYKKYGAIIQGINSNSNENLSYSFDSSICAKGLLDYFEMSKKTLYLDYAKKILTDLINEAIDQDGSVKPFKQISSNQYQESNQVWYKQEGCLHIKTSIPYFQLYKITNEEKYLHIASKICDQISTYQNSDGSIKLHQESQVINLHTLCYALEGLLYGFHITKNPIYKKSCESAVNWCLNQINEDGSISLWFNSKYHNKAAYPIAQLIRIISLLHKVNPDLDYNSFIPNLFKFLISLQASNSDPKIDGGFYEEFYKSIFGWKKRLRINSWTSMFALQAIYWYENLDTITFDDQINFLY